MSLAALEAAKAAKALAITLNDHGMTPRFADDDVFVATNARDSFNGGLGTDTVSYMQSSAGVNVYLQAGVQGSGGMATGDTLISVENAIGSGQRDQLFGTSGANTLVGLGGDDNLFGNFGSDRLFGDGGNDYILGLARTFETVLIDGGTGDDTLIFHTRGGDATIVTGAGLDKVEIEIGNSESFHIVIKDFNPYVEMQSIFGRITEAEANTGDRIAIKFDQDHFAGEHDLFAHRLEAVGDDIILHLTHPGVDGEIVFENLGQQVDLIGPFSRMNEDFLIDFGTFARLLPA